MNRYSLTHLTPEAACRRLEQVDLEEKGRLADGLALIALIDKRRDYRAAGYSSMLRYCRGRLKMSEDKAAKRLQVARVARRYPQVFDAIADGRLCVSGAVALAPHLGPRTVDELLAASAYLSRDEIVRMLFARSRRADGAAVVCSGETTSGIGQDPAVPGQVGSLADLCATAEAGAPVLQHAPSMKAGCQRPRFCDSSAPRPSLTSRLFGVKLLPQVSLRRAGSHTGQRASRLWGMPGSPARDSASVAVMNGSESPRFLQADCAALLLRR